MKHAHQVKHLDRLVLVGVGVQVHPGIEFVNTSIKKGESSTVAKRQTVMCFENQSKRCKYKRLPSCDDEKLPVREKMLQVLHYLVPDLKLRTSSFLLEFF